MSWDSRAERIAARGQAEVAAAEAARIRAEADAAARRSNAELDREDDDRRRAQSAQRRQALKATVAGHGDKLVPILAIGSPAVIAWSGQYKFATEVMKLGMLAPLLPIALEGSVLYAAMLTHKAVDAQLPTGRYRALTWALAGVAAGMNFSHGKEISTEVGVALALTSLLSIVLLEMTVALRARRVAGTNAAAIRQGLIRRLRYPALSAQAASLAAARGITAEEAWTAAWIDRYGIGPDSTRRERKVARQILKRQRGTALDDIETGDLTITDGRLVSAQSAPAERPSAPAADLPTVQEWALNGEVTDGLKELEEYLAENAHTALIEMPERAESERPGERSDDHDGERSVERKGERSPRRKSAQRERSQQPKVSARKQSKKSSIERVRAYLDEHPNASTADIKKALGIGESTARRLRTQVLGERKGGQQ